MLMTASVAPRAAMFNRGECRGAHASRVLVAAPPARRASDGIRQSKRARLQHTAREVRFGGTPKPARGTRALPGFAVATLARYPCAAAFSSSTAAATSTDGAMLMTTNLLVGVLLRSAVLLIGTSTFVSGK